MEQVCFELENLEMTYLDKEILKIERLAVHQFDRIGIVGKNGAGKSTLLKLLANNIQPTRGTVKRHVESGYFKQLEAPTVEEADGALLGRLAVPKNSEELSGGEQTRLKLAQLFTHYYEALLIDEPTTHLDQEGISQKVVYSDAKPQDFEKSEQLVVTGKSEGEVFYAEQILMKCPSKYVEDEIDHVDASKTDPETLEQ